VRALTFSAVPADPLLVCDENKLKVIRTDARKFLFAPEIQLNLTRTTIKARILIFITLLCASKSFFLGCIRVFLPCLKMIFFSFFSGILFYCIFVLLCCSIFYIYFDVLCSDSRVCATAIWYNVV
jgi:hypothetical protein